LNGITIIREAASPLYLVQHASQIVKVIKITKESFLTVRPVFSTENLRKKKKNKRIPTITS
jgi:hypothetical protein